MLIRDGGAMQIGGGATLPIRCHACESVIEGEPGGTGLLVFPRGDGVHYEEPPLCRRCAHAIGVTALWRFAAEEEEG